MLTEFNDLLANPEQYSCVYRDGEIFFDLNDEGGSDV